MKDITAIIIAKNEGERIEKCIKSVKFCTEVIVIDNLSTDKTGALAEKSGARVYSSDATNYSDLRNYAIKIAKSSWILYVDADEVVTSDLAGEIIKTVKSENDYVAFRLRRKNFYLGDNPWPKIEKLERLFLKEKLIKWEGALHESPKVSGRVGELQGFLLHYSHRTISEMVQKTLIWSDVEAQLRFKAGHPKMVWWRFPRVMLSAFLDSYLSQGGWKVGTVGLIESIYQAYSSFITYAKLWEMQQGYDTKNEEKP